MCFRLEGGLAAESQPLPVLNGSKEGFGELIAQQLEDDSLIYARRNGEEEKDGFCFNKNGLLTHTKISDLGKIMVRVVIPKNRRQEVLDIAHKGLAGGHFSEKRTYLSICAHFWWPQMRKSVSELFGSLHNSGGPNKSATGEQSTIAIITYTINTNNNH